MTTCIAVHTMAKRTRQEIYEPLSTTRQCPLPPWPRQYIRISLSFANLRFRSRLDFYPPPGSRLGLQGCDTAMRYCSTSDFPTFVSLFFHPYTSLYSRTERRERHDPTLYRSCTHAFGPLYIDI
jgi:hypothetical protein